MVTYTTPVEWEKYVPHHPICLFALSVDGEDELPPCLSLNSVLMINSVLVLYISVNYWLQCIVLKYF